MKKTMKRTVTALCVALAVFVCDSSLAFAAVCSKAPDGVHHFSVHRRAGAGYSVDGGTHRYLYGFDVNNNPIYKDNCSLTMGYEYCNMQCRYCTTYQENSQHEHYTSTRHSINHN